MTAENGYLVDYRLVPIGPGADPYPPDGEWAEPDVEQAAELMREVVERSRRGAAQGRARAGRPAPSATRSRRPARSMRERLERVHGGVRRAARAARLGAGALDTRRLRDRVSSGPGPTPARVRFGKPQVARAQGAAARPEALHGARADDRLELVQSLEALDRSVQALTMNSTAVDAATNDRIDDLAGQVDALRSDLGRACGFMASFGLGGAAPTARRSSSATGPHAPEEPWTPEYVERHRAFVTRALDDPALLNLLKRGRALPAGYGVGFDERVVEFPWALDARPRRAACSTPARRSTIRTC